MAEEEGGFSIDIPCTDGNTLPYFVPIYAFIFAYMFLVTSVLTDDYFVPSLEKLAIRWRLSNDVAGATLMAIGSSGPEISVNILDTIFGEADLGLTAVVGSALFNVCLITTVCIVFAPSPLQISPRPYIRDFCFYLISIGILTAAINDYEVECIEAFGLVFVYALYVGFLMYQDKIFPMIDRLLGIQGSYGEQVADVPLDKHKESIGGDYAPLGGEDKENDEFDYTVRFDELPLGFEIHPCPNYINCTVGKMLNDYTKSKLIKGSKIVAVNDMWVHGDSTRRITELVISEARRLPITITFRAKEWMTQDNSNQGKGYYARNSIVLNLGSQQVTERISHDPRRDDSPVHVDDLVEYSHHSGTEEEEGMIDQIYNCMAYPVEIMFDTTIPKSLALSFVGSIVWILIISWVLTQLTRLIGCAANVKISLMGLIFLAAGTSVPDMLCSIIVARKMEGDMAISNISGSNIGNILLGIGLPWFVETIVSGEPHRPETQGLNDYFMYLIFAQCTSCIAFACCNFTLHYWLSYLLCGLYVGFVGLVLYVER